MEHVGEEIRKIRREKGLSAEYIAGSLKKPITRQAFENRERTGNFDWGAVLEVANILKVDPKIFLADRKLKVDKMRNPAS